MYVRDLITSLPTISRTRDSQWEMGQVKMVELPEMAILSGGAFRWNPKEELADVLTRLQLDIAFAIEYGSREQPTLLHVVSSRTANLLFPKVEQLVWEFRGRLEVQIH